MKNICYQGNNHDCGFAALKMLFATISKNKNYLYLPKTSQSEGFTFLDLIEIAAIHQVNLAAYEMEFEKIPEQRFPMLVQVVGNHTIILLKVKKGYFYFNDPAKGRVKMRDHDFEKIYAGKVLVVENENLDRKFKAKKPQLMSKSYGIVHLVVAALVVTMLGLDFYLMNLSENVPFIFLLIVFLILVEVFENWYLLKTSNFFDQTYIPLYFRKTKYQNYEDYQKYLSVKTELFNSSKSMVVFSSLAIILGVLICINDLRNLLVVAVIALYKAMEKYITQFKDEKVIQEISNGERGVFDSADSPIATLIHINHKANDYALSITTRNCFFQLVLMLLTLFMMVLSNNMSANFAVFHFGIYFVIGQGINLIFERITRHQDNLRNKAQFFDKCGL